MERPPHGPYLPLACLLSLLLLLLLPSGDGGDDSGFGFDSKLAQQLHDLRVANFPQMSSHRGGHQHSGHVDSRARNGGGTCSTWIGTVVGERDSWEEGHCRRCVCDPELGAVCTRPLCGMDARSFLESNCEEWSSDGCCCLRASCLHEGVRYATNDWFLLTPSDPCTVCKCDPSQGLPQCVETTCPPAECVNATFVQGQCCPVCVEGGNCGLPPLAFPEGDVIADDSPVDAFTSRVVTLLDNVSLAWNCTCLEAGDAAHCVLIKSRTET